MSGPSNPNYAVQPPAYGSVPVKGPKSPLLAAPSPAMGRRFEDDEEDFMYGTTVSESSAAVRHAFIRKVYTILFTQILATCIFAGLLSQNKEAVFWVQTHTWSFYTPMFATFVNLGLLYWKRLSHPWNFVLLSTFTLLESFTLGIVVAFYDDIVVLQALLITLGVFGGLTLFTFQSKYDFSGMGPWLFGGLIAMVMTGFVHLVFPFSSGFNFIMSIFGTLLFSGYVVYDTYMISNRLSADEYIMGAISLYLDFINLFLQILSLLSNNRD